MAALQCCADFGCTRAWMSYVYTCTPPTWSSVPPSSVSKPTLYIRISLPALQIGSSLMKNFNTATEFPFLSHIFFLNNHFFWVVEISDLQKNCQASIGSSCLPLTHSTHGDVFHQFSFVAQPCLTP